MLITGNTHENCTLVPYTQTSLLPPEAPATPPLKREELLKTSRPSSTAGPLMASGIKRRSPRYFSRGTGGLPLRRLRQPAIPIPLPILRCAVPNCHAASNNQGLHAGGQRWQRSTGTRAPLSSAARQTKAPADNVSTAVRKLNLNMISLLFILMARMVFVP